MRISDEGRLALSKTANLEARFRAKVKSTPKDECWLWTGAKSGGNGYGTLRNETGAVDYAHRVSHKIFKGPIPAGKKVLHTCDCRACTNPNHLYVGTHDDNVRDAIERERYVRRGKLRPAQVMAIVMESRKGVTHVALSERFHVSTEAIARIMQGVSWSKLTGIKRYQKSKRRGSRT